MKSEARITIASGADIVTARLEGRQLAAQAGFEGSDLTVIATAISEVARNIVEYARKGEITFAHCPRWQQEGAAHRSAG